MDTYIYQAAVYCEDCALKIKDELDKDTAHHKYPPDVEDETTFDSDDYPKGPYSDEDNKADCPQHCDSCHAFLENPLTDEGYDYVLERMLASDEMNAAFQPGQILSTTIREWAEYYELMSFWDTPYFDRFDVCEAWHMYAMLHHKGQRSTEYEIFGRLEHIKFRPARGNKSPRDLSDNGKAIYGRLVMGLSKIRERQTV